MRKGLKKYPRTLHLPWSEGITNDDKILLDISTFEGKQVVITEKMDGENFTLYSDYCHARSLDGNYHVSQSYIRQLHANLKNDIPEKWRVCGEYLYAKHSIRYTNLEDYFLVFSIWNDSNICLSWEETESWISLFGLKSVPVLYKGLFSKKICEGVWKNLSSDKNEGYVVRISGEFDFDNFGQNVAKFVRKNHVTTNNHWKYSIIEQNLLQKE